MIKSSFVLVLAACSAFGSAAHSQTSGFSRFDYDNNGRITSEELGGQGNQEIVAALDSNKDGAITTDEWQLRGRGSSYVEKGGVDAQGIARRWLEFRVVFFSLEGGVVATQLHEGQAQLAADAEPSDIEAMQAILDARFIKEQESYPAVYRVR